MAIRGKKRKKGTRVIGLSFLCRGGGGGGEKGPASVRPPPGSLTLDHRRKRKKKREEEGPYTSFTKKGREKTIGAEAILYHPWGKKKRGKERIFLSRGKGKERRGARVFFVQDPKEQRKRGGEGRGSVASPYLRAGTKVKGKEPASPAHN